MTTDTTIVAPPSSFCHVVAVVTFRGTFPPRAGATLPLGHPDHPRAVLGVFACRLDCLVDVLCDWLELGLSAGAVPADLLITGGREDD